MFSTRQASHKRRSHLINRLNLFSIGEVMAFRGKNAVVTGGSGGIGLETVKQLLQHEVDVMWECLVSHCVKELSFYRI